MKVIANIEIEIFSFTVRNTGDTSRRSSLLEGASEDENNENDNFRFGNIHGLTNVTVQVGTIAYMHCPVVNLGEREVSIFIID